MSNFTHPTLLAKASVFLRSMLSVVFMGLVVLFLSAWSFQDGEEKVTIKGSDVPLITVFKTIKKQAGYNFFYAADYVNDREKVNLDVKNARVEDVLQKVLGRDYVWVYNDNAVSITKKKKEEKKRVIENVTDSINNPAFVSISGRVTDASGNSLPGATVIVKGTNGGVTTDNNGKFLLSSIPFNAVLVISTVGFEKREVVVKGKNIMVQLNVDVNDLDETVVVAYNKTTQRANTGAVTVVRGDQIQTLPNRSFDKSLQGLVPGLLVTSGNGQPGSSPVNFTLRGIATGGSVDNGSTVRNPLIVVDGIPVLQEPSRGKGAIPSESSPVNNPMAHLNPSDIESISVLKDAAAIALYGSKASNGVILITTKKGKVGKTVFNFRHQTDVASRLEGKIDLLNQQEYLELLFEAYRNSNPGMTDSEILADLRTTPSPVFPKFPTMVSSAGDTSFYPVENWKDAYYNKAAVSMTNEVSMSGGNDRGSFYLNLEYTKQDGVVKGSGFDRKSLRFNYESRPASWFKLGLNTSLSYNRQNYVDNGSFVKMEVVSPLNPIYKEAGAYIDNYLWGFYSSDGNLISNPVAAAELNINRNTAYRGLSRLYGELKFLKHFTLSSSFGVDFLLNELKEKIHPRLAIDGTLDYEGKIMQENFRNANLITTNTLQFDKLLRKDHNINLLLGQEAQILSVQTSGVEVRGFPDNPSQDQATEGTVFQAGSTAGKQTLLSYFSQLNYNFKSKYFLSGSMRTDGSSQFGRNERFGTYWSIGGGWIVSAEQFMKGVNKWLNYLKLRGSFGPAGNSSAITNDLRFDRLVMLDYLGGIAVLPDRGSNPGNPSIQWEQTFTWDAGLELRLLNERVIATADIYGRKTTNLIASNIPLPSATGFTYTTDNIGDIKNSGVELAISAGIISNRNFSWNVNANWSRNQNKFTRAALPLEYVGENVANEVGREYNSFYMPIWAGVNPANGRPMWIDSTGKASEDYYAAKREFVGKTQPDGFGAVTNTFSCKGFELSIMIYYQYGAQVYYNGAVLQNDGIEPYANQSKTALNRWQKPGDIAANPRRLLYGRLGTEVDMGTSPSTRYLYDGNFIRLSNISVSYNFPLSMLSKVHLTGLKLFLQGHNIATWTKYSGQDPENVNALGAGNFLYPQQRSFTIGVNASF